MKNYVVEHQFHEVIQHDCFIAAPITKQVQCQTYKENITKDQCQTIAKHM